LSRLFCRKVLDEYRYTWRYTTNTVQFVADTSDNIAFTFMTCFPLHFSRPAPTSLRRSAAPVRSGPPLETATVPPRELRRDRHRRRQSSLSVMNAGDQACPETRPCPHPSPGGRKPARTLAGKADGTDVLLGNVESQHRHAAQLSTHANAVAERWIESCRRELLDHVIAVNERHLKRLLFDYVRYHHEDRTHLGLGKGTPARRICSANAGRVISHDRLGGLHHRYDRAA